MQVMSAFPLCGINNSSQAGKEQYWNTKAHEIFHEPEKICYLYGNAKTRPLYILAFQVFIIGHQPIGYSVGSYFNYAVGDGLQQLMIMGYDKYRSWKSS